MTLLKGIMSPILFVLFLFLFPFCAGQQEEDFPVACWQKPLTLFEITKRWPFHTSNETVDDSANQDGIYISSENSALLDYPPGVGRCGGKYPIWMKELKKDSAVVCVQNEDDTCFKEFEVKHTDCQPDTVYELKTVVKGSVFCLQPKFCATSWYLCGNGGTCIDERDGIFCQCPDGFSGPTCEGDPCSISRPLHGVHERLPSNNVLTLSNRIHTPGWYSVPKGMKTGHNAPKTFPACGSNVPIWSVERRGNFEVVCEEHHQFSCTDPFVMMTRTCTNKTASTQPAYSDICLDLCLQQEMNLFEVVMRWPFYTGNQTVDDSTNENEIYLNSMRGSILDYPPGVGHCGGKYPIWQKEVKHGSAVVCVQNEDDTCFKEFKVKRQKCSHNDVYELKSVVKGSVFCLQPKFCTFSRYLCGNGGTCIDERDGVSCQCPDGFSGPTCQGDPCSISRPLPQLDERMPSNHVVSTTTTSLTSGWYSVPKGMKTATNVPKKLPACGSHLPVWTVERLGNIEVVCQAQYSNICLSPYVIMTKTCANTRVSTQLRRSSPCFECRPGPLDVLVIEDVSSSIMNSDYKKMKDFILDSIRGLNISRTDNNVAFLSFASTAKVGFHLNTYSNTTGVVEAIASAHGTGGGTLVSTALELSASDVFTYHNGDRVDADNIVLLFTDGIFKDDTSLEEDIETLKGRAEIYVVRVGPVVSNSTLVEIATTLDHILNLGHPSTATVITSALNPSCRAEQ